jgi:hypothetical protein
MINLAAAFLLFIGIGLVAGGICKSLDCIGGNKTACEIVAKRYEAKP